MKLVYIEWEDSVSETAWRSGEELKKFIEDDNCTVQQIGWILKEDKKYIVIASRQSQTVDYETEFGCIQKIPKGWIRKRVDLTKHV